LYWRMPPEIFTEDGEVSIFMRYRLEPYHTKARYRDEWAYKPEGEEMNEV